MSEQVSSKLLKSLESLLGVLNPDKDGGYFICEEAESIVREARKAIREAVPTEDHRKPEMKTYTVISKYSAWIFDDVEAESKEKALTKAFDFSHEDEQIGEVATFFEHTIKDIDEWSES